MVETVEDCDRVFNVQKELFRVDRTVRWNPKPPKVRFGVDSSGSWKGIPWSVVFQPNRSYLSFGPRRFELVVILNAGSLRFVPPERQGFKVLVKGNDGANSTSIFVTKNGIGTKNELDLEWKSNLLSHRKRDALARAKLLGQLTGEQPTVEWTATHSDWLPKKNRKRLRWWTVKRLRKRLGEVVTEDPSSSF